jgi:endonuclease/exonuclease/phosphatase family metal-dependent hydrolase
MPELRIMTFNVENMMVRFNFSKREEEGLISLPEIDDPVERAELIRTYWNVLTDEARVFTALTMASENPEVICMMEVEDMPAMKKFHDSYLRRFSREYKYKYLINANDKRGIDVAVMSRDKIGAVVSHQQMEETIAYPDPKKPKKQRVFSRDCLEVNVEKNKKTLAIFVCHFKSMMGGRPQTKVKREAEAAAVRKIIEERYDNPAKSDWIIVGDLNDYTEDHQGKPDTGHGLGPLLDDGFCVDLVKKIKTPEDRWTHFYAGKREYHQLDYILVSPSLAKKNPGVAPVIVRNGTPYRAEEYRGERWPRVGWDRPKASDHCPVVVTLGF